MVLNISVRTGIAAMAEMEKKQKATMLKKPGSFECSAGAMAAVKGKLNPEEIAPKTAKSKKTIRSKAVL